MRIPKLSIILPTYNAEADMKRFFTYFDKQSFNKSDVELLIMDGGSTDGTVELSVLHGAKVIHNPRKLAEPGAALGFSHAKAPLIMILAADNIFPDDDAIKNMISVFDDPTIIAAFPKHDTGPGDNIYSHYINTFTDPYTHFVYGDSANARTFHKIYKTIKRTKIYDVFDYTSSKSRPIIALAQGFTIRKSKMPSRKEVSDDILTVYRLIDQGNQIAYVHGVTLWHYTIRDIHQFISKQKRGVENALHRRDSGITKRQNVMTHSQKIRMVLFIPYALTIIPALIQSIAGFVTTGERMWLVHWYMCLFSALCIVRFSFPIMVKRYI